MPVQCVKMYLRIRNLFFQDGKSEPATLKEDFFGDFFDREKYFHRSVPISDDVRI